jgi:hypothetical protein
MFAFREKTGTRILFGYDEASDDNRFAHQLGAHYRNLLNNWQERSNEAYLLRYEDLILNPEETLAAFLDYLELDSRVPTVQHVLQTATEIATEYLSWHQTSASQRKSIERWRRDLSPSLQAVCQQAFGDVLKEFGYPA